MRSLVLIALPLLASGCWTPGPGQMDPTRYPWDPKYRQAGVAPGTYCIVSLEMGNSSGITVRGRAPGNNRVIAIGKVPSFEQVPPGANTVQMACKPPPPDRR